MDDQPTASDSWALRESAMKSIRTQVEAKRLSNWLYPSDSPVKGFDGFGPIMLVGFRPHTKDWPPTDIGRQRLYGAIRDLGTGFDCHITDCLKSRATVAKDKVFDKEEEEWSITILRAEIAVVRPPFLIVLGKKALQFLVKARCHGDLGLFNIGHYSDPFEGPEGMQDPFQMRLAGKVMDVKTTQEWRDWEALKARNAPPDGFVGASVLD